MMPELRRANSRVDATKNYTQSRRENVRQASQAVLFSLNALLFDSGAHFITSLHLFINDGEDAVFSQAQSTAISPRGRPPWQLYCGAGPRTTCTKASGRIHF